MHGALALALVLSVPANVEEAPAFQEGQGLYRDLEFEAAAQKFQAAADDESLTESDRAVAHVWVGMCFAGIGDENKARDALREALHLDLNVSLPDVAPPKVRQLADELRSEVEAEQAVAEPELVEEPEPEDEPSDDVGTAGGEDLPILLIAGGATAGLGALVLGSGGVLYGLSLLQFGDCTAQKDGNGFQSDVGACVDVANAEAATGIVLTAAGVVLVGVGGALIAVDLAME